MSDRIRYGGEWDDDHRLFARARIGTPIVAVLRGSDPVGPGQPMVTTRAQAGGVSGA
ncbi:hypothetical protein [Streptomyces sp. CC219B]|uniref:hypothetical protein n=1 Tax=Streptomyces sp. CC219B TaxID=3044574 RepID=UPI0024A96578|nr:hypothetical protein [Streptomyces sp. CC219B]